MSNFLERLITIEILLVLLLRQKPDVARIMREADAMLQEIEVDLHEGASTYERLFEMQFNAR